MFGYPVKFTQDDNDTILVTSPDFPELTTFGDDDDDALLHAVDALEEVVAARIAERGEIPRPSPARGRPMVYLPTQTALKVLLYQSMREKGLRKAELARRLNWHAPQVDRLFDVRHASRLDQIDAAFNVLDLHLEFTVERRAA